MNFVLTAVLWACGGRARILEMSIAAKDAERIRTCVAQSLAAAVKAYDLPRTAMRLGMSDGTDEEAFRSKRIYVLSRLRDWKRPELLKLAQSVVDEFEAPDLSDLLSELTTHADRRLSTFTRREILKATDFLGSLFGEHPQSLYECLEVIAPRWDHIRDPAVSLRSLKDEVEQHCLRNPGDWSYSELLRNCGALECSQGRFFQLIEALLHPLARHGDEQKQLFERLDPILKVQGFALAIKAYESSHAIYEVQRLASGVAGSLKNLIFASIGEKPDIVLADAINNDVRITKHADKCLIYDRPLSSSGLKWVDLANWWQETQGLEASAARKALGERLLDAVKRTQSIPELVLFKSYYKTFLGGLGDDLPALIPQVYLHYDPQTIAQRGGRPALPRQRMDFLMLLSGGVRIVIEMDGKQHYSDGEFASPKLYAEMVREDRALRLRGYEVYRFGAYELYDSRIAGSRLVVGPYSASAIRTFFTDLFGRHGVVPSNRG